MLTEINNKNAHPLGLPERGYPIITSKNQNKDGIPNAPYGYPTICGKKSTTKRATKHVANIYKPTSMKEKSQITRQTITFK